MAIQICELLDFSEKLLTLNSECAWRSAISRSYYAAYHRALLWEQEEHIDGMNVGQAGGVHQQLFNRLRNPSAALPAELRRRSMHLGTKLQVQKERRATADYRLMRDIPLSEAQLQVTQARQVVEIHCAPSRRASEV